MTRSLVFAALAFASAAQAGDCPTHPVTLIELEVVSCAPFDAASAAHVVDFDGVMRRTGAKREALEKQVAGLAAERPSMVLEVKTRRARVIEVDAFGHQAIKPKAEPWTPAVESRWLLLKTADAAACKRFPPNNTVVLAHFTDCSCDTGPVGWCVVKHDSVVGEVPADLAQFAR